jgi:hypothetical protein
MVAQGESLHDQNPCVYCTPTIPGGSPAQHMSHHRSRWACYLAAVWGVRLRPMALICSALLLLPLPMASIKRGIDAIGGHLPAPEAMLRPLWAHPPATACHLDGDYPLGTAPCVLVVKAVWPQVRFPAEPCQTGKHSWGHRKQALLSYRRQGKANGDDCHDHSRRKGYQDRCNPVATATNAAQSLASRMLTPLLIEPLPRAYRLARRSKYLCPHGRGPSWDWKHSLCDRDRLLSLAYPLSPVVSCCPLNSQRYRRDTHGESNIVGSDRS